MSDGPNGSLKRHGVMNRNKRLLKRKQENAIVMNKTGAAVNTRNDLNTNIVRNDDRRKTGRRIVARRFPRFVFSPLRLVGLPAVNKTSFVRDKDKMRSESKLRNKGRMRSVGRMRNEGKPRSEGKRKTGRRTVARRFPRFVPSLLHLVEFTFPSQLRWLAIRRPLLLRNILLHRLLDGRADLSGPILLPIVHPQLLQ